MLFPVLLAAVLMLLLVSIQPLVAAWRYTQPRRRRPDGRTPAEWGVDYEDVSIVSSDGARLRGWYVSSRNGAAVTLFHDHGDNRLAIAGTAEALARAGYGVLLFDLRAHGESDGRRLAGCGEAIQDARLAVAWLARRPDVTGRIGVLGVGLGGTLAIQVAATSAHVRAIAAENPGLATAGDLPPPRGLLDQFWYHPQERYYQAAVRRLARGTPPPANVVVLPRLAGRPILFISAGHDTEQHLTRHLYAAAARPKRLLAASNARGAGPEAHTQELLAFFDHALCGAKAVEETESSGEVAASSAAEELPAAIDERTVAPPAAMMFAFATIPLAMISLFLPFQLRWGLAPPRLPGDRPVSALLGIFALFLAGLLLHEAVHVAGYYLFGHVRRSAVHLGGGGAGMALRARSAEPVSARAYRAILALPAVFLGVLPGALGVAIGSWLLVIWAVWMLVLSGSDLAALWAMRDLPGPTPVRAHPLRPGCEVLPDKYVQNIDK